MQKRRIENLDSLRAFAILMVLVFHSTQVFAEQLPLLWKITSAGFLGVDLFFALSGYLIGSLFFMEQNRNGKVAIPRFILRRVSRTVPPYFVALLLSYLAVYIYRKQAFDPGYLFFIQNYYQELPFFLISWSLCVEEHFYLLLPVVLSVLFIRYKQPSMVVVMILFALSLVPLCLRLAYQDIDPKLFGYYRTATHLKYDPLIWGVLMAYVSIYFESRMTSLLRYKYIIYGLSVLLVLSYSWWPDQWMYSVGAYLLGLGFALSVAVACKDQSWSISKIKLIPVIAVCSYAIYLTHALTLHALTRLHGFLGLESIGFQLVSMLLVACLTGYAFYYVIEKPVMKWRKKHVPSYRSVKDRSDYAPTSY